MHVAIRASGKGRHQIRDHILLFAGRPALLLEQVQELLEDFAAGLPHQSKDGIGQMLWRDLELAADELAHQCRDILRIFQGQVVADAAGDADVLDLGQLLHLPQQFERLHLVDHEMRADRGRQTTGALAPRGIIIAVGLPHIGTGSADIADAATEFRVSRQFFGLLQKRCLATRADGAPLMDRQGTE